MPTPFLLILGAALLGALFLAVVFGRAGGNILIGGALGGAAGAAGSLLFMLPLNFCPFEAERTATDGFIGLILIGIGMAALLLPLRWLARRRLLPRPQSVVNAQPGLFRGRFTPWLLLAPTLLILILFLYYPSLDTLRLSTLLIGMNVQRSRFVCVQNFSELLGNPDYFSSIGVTFGIAFAVIVIGLSLSLLVAVMAFQPVRGGNLYRTLLIWPYAISPAIAGIIFSLIFNPVGGLANYLSESMFGLKLPWLTDPMLAPWAVILASVWKSMGFSILFYLAGLQNIPNDLREAAAIDGANAFWRFVYVVFPLLSPITFFLIITNLTYAFFDIYGMVDVLTTGGPSGATTVMMYRIVEQGQFSTIGLGRAAAESVVLFLIVIGVTLFQFMSTGRRVNYGA